MFKLDFVLSLSYRDTYKKILFFCKYFNIKILQRFLEWFIICLGIDNTKDQKLGA